MKRKFIKSLLVLLLSLLFVSCPNNVINTGACGENASTPGVGVINIKGENYYWVKENYYYYPQDAPKEIYDTIVNEDLFREIVVDRWKEWILGVWDSSTEDMWGKQPRSSFDIFWPNGIKEYGQRPPTTYVVIKQGTFLVEEGYTVFYLADKEKREIQWRATNEINPIVINMHYKYRDLDEIEPLVR